MTRASDRWGRGKRLWIKRDDLTGSTLTGNKVRKLEFIVGHAQASGIDTLITCGGLQSNHARATAGVCAQVGMHCVLVLRGTQPEQTGNTLLDQLFGAELRAIPTSEYVADLPGLLTQAADEQRGLGRTPLVIPTGGSDGLGIWGYIAGAQELAADLTAHGIDRCTVICATGSGGTQAGLTFGFALQDLPVSVVGMAVCDDTEWFNRKVMDDVEELSRLYPQTPEVAVSPTTIDSYIGAGYGKASSAVYRLIADLAALEGIVLDPVYTGKAFLGMITEIEQGRFGDSEDIVFVHTGGIFGLFPHHAGLSEALEATV